MTVRHRDVAQQDTAKVAASTAWRGLPLGDRIPELDAIRGVAAMVVVLFHCWKAFPWPHVGLMQAWAGAGPSALARWEILFKVTPLRLVTAGIASVGVFFTLSGLVLALPMVRGRTDRYGPFLVKRFFRLYPPFAAAVFLALALCAAVQPHAVAGLSEWFNHSWDRPLSATLVGGHLGMLGLDADMRLDNVMWSLVHEVRISLVFPFLCLAALAAPRLVTITAATLMVLLSYGPCFSWIRGQLDVAGPFWPVATILDTVRYALYFVAGIAIASHLHPWVNWARNRPAWLRGIGWLGTFCLLVAQIGPMGDLLWVAGASLAIILSLSSDPARSFLRHGALQWLGKVSYSLYLVHLPLLLTVVHLGLRAGLGLWPLAAVPVLALLAADVFYNLVEAPSHKLGRRMLKKAAAPGDAPAPA